MKKSHLKHKSLMLLLMLMLFSSLLTFANSAEPPSIVILVTNPPEDLSVVLISNENQTEAKYRKTAWEGYYLFYYNDTKPLDQYTFLVSTNGESFECSFNQPLGHYNEILTLDLSTQSLTYGVFPFRDILLISFRVILTLLIEGIVFWLFKFREKRSWILFVLINMFTQGALNFFLFGDNNVLTNSYYVYALVFLEIFVLFAEAIAFTLLLREHQDRRIFAYVFIANFLSLIAGGYLIMHLPI